MRFLACLAMLCCVTPALAGQQNERQPDPDEVTIRGCLHDPLELWANEPSRQAFDSYNSVDKGQRFALLGDRDVLYELGDHVRHEIEVTGLLTIPEGSSPAIVEPPRGPGGAFPGPPPTGQFRPPSFGTDRLTVRSHDGPVTNFLVTEFEHVSLECRQ